MITIWDPASAVFYLAYTLIPACVGIRRLFGYPNQATLSGLMSIHALSDTPEVRAMLREYLGRRRLIRTVAFILGWSVLPWIAFWINPNPNSKQRIDLTAFIFGIIALGVLVAELAHRRRGTSKALLDVRRLDDYRRGFSRWDNWIMALALISITAFGVIHDRDYQGAWKKPDAWFLGSLAIGLAAIVCVWVMQTWLVRRRRPFESEELTQADDVIRMMSVGGLSAFGYAVPLYAFAEMAWNLIIGTHLPWWVSFPIIIAILAAMVASFVLLFGYLGIGTPEWRRFRRRS